MWRIGLLLFAISAAACGKKDAYGVSAVLETAPLAVEGLPTSKTTADDLCLWVHPRDRSKSIIIATSKPESSPGLYGFSLRGEQLWTTTALARYNNVDLRTGFPAEEAKWDLVCATNRTQKTVDVYRVLPDTGTLELKGVIPTGLSDPYGLTMARDLKKNLFYVYVTNADEVGFVQQFQLVYDADKKTVKAKLGQRFISSLGQDGDHQCEGAVADDELEMVFIAEENYGIYGYPMAPDGSLKVKQRVEIGKGVLRTGDIEGLALYKAKDNKGYLIACEQQGESKNASFAIFERYDNNMNNIPYEFLFRFEITYKRKKIDGCEDTDGIEVCSLDLGEPFSKGLFIAHDGKNTLPEAHQNFKLVPWEKIATLPRNPKKHLIVDR